MLRNENIPVVHQEHAYDDADVALTMALPWVHELGWPFTAVRLAAGPRTSVMHPWIGSVKNKNGYFGLSSYSGLAAAVRQCCLPRRPMHAEKVRVAFFDHIMVGRISSDVFGSSCVLSEM